MPPTGDLAVVIPALNEADRIGATVTAAAGIAGVDVVVVVDDGSGDDTAAAAEAAGASVVTGASPARTKAGACGARADGPA